MGSTCCCSDVSTADTELGKHNKQVQFFAKFVHIGDTYKSKIEKELPKNWNINLDLETKVVGQGIFLGKSNTKARQGYGVMLYDIGYYYVGTWFDNYRSGLGYMIAPNGAYYKGEWQTDQPNGYGEYHDAKHDWHYKGQWKRGFKNGIGEETFPDGTKFVGEFKDNHRHQRGKFIFDKKCFMKGFFVNDVAEGPNGEQRGEDFLYEGPFSNDDFNGAARVTYYRNEGDKDIEVERYIGEFRDGLKHGYGEYTWEDGSVYKGEWRRGSIANRGVFIESN